MAAIVKKIEIPLSKYSAFEVFVNDLNGWWPKEYTWSQEKLKQILIEPEKNGLCIEIGPYNFRCDWGRVTGFEKGDRISIKWQISPQRVPVPDPDKSSDVDVVFKEKTESETILELMHSNFENHGEGSEAYREAMNSEQGWGYILSRFVEYCKTK